MSKYFYFLFGVSVLFLCSFKGLGILEHSLQMVAQPDEAEVVDNVWFPVILSTDQNQSYTMYAEAIVRYRESVLKRQQAIKLVLDSVPGLAEISKTKTEQNDTFQIYRTNWFLVKNLLKRPQYLDTLLAGNAFLGFDTEQSIIAAQKAERSKAARNKESALPKASRDRENLIASAKADPNASPIAMLKSAKQNLQNQVRGLNAVYIDELMNPVFTDTLLLRTFPDESELDCVAKYASRVLVLRNAYPDWFQTLNQNYLSLVNKGDWFGLFNYAKGKLDPLSENHKAYISKHMRAFSANNQ